MASTRVPRLCAALSSIENLSIHTSSSSRNTRPSACHVLSRPCRGSSLRHIPGQPTRAFATSSTHGSDNITPTQQQSKAKKMRERTIQLSKTSNSRSTTRKGERTPATAAQSASSEESSSTPNTTATTVQATSTILSTPSDQTPPTPNRFTHQSQRIITGTVVRTGTMTKTVAVSTNVQQFDRFLQKHYTKPAKTLVHDPDDNLVEGDVIEYALFPPEDRAARIAEKRGTQVKYKVQRVVTPFGVPLSQRAGREPVALA